MIRPPTLAIVGGMLGAGKTTLILDAARRLTARGLRVAIITNDQGDDLVDTALARAAGMSVGEVAGGCFCCRLSQLLEAADSLRHVQPDVIFAEPVGSCVDLAATVVRPLMRDEPGRFTLAPLTVLVDPARARDVADAPPDSDLAFLFAHQLAEADLVCFTKADLVPPHALPGVAGHALSARTGQGVDPWLDLLLADGSPAGAMVIAVDYERYAHAEAALAWVNWHVRLDLDEAELPAVVVGQIADALDEGLGAAGMAAAHVKVLDQAPTGGLRASLIARGEAPQIDGRLDASPATRHDLLVNARAFGDPEALSRIVGAALAPFGVAATIERREAFRPSPPRPERRA